jgi:hypothetical protein
MLVCTIETSSPSVESTSATIATLNAVGCNRGSAGPRRVLGEGGPSLVTPSL